MYDSEFLQNIYKKKENYLGYTDEGVLENNCGDAVFFSFTPNGSLGWGGQGCFLTVCAAEVICIWYNREEKEKISIGRLKNEIIGHLPPKRNQCLQVVIDAYGLLNNKKG